MSTAFAAQILQSSANGIAGLATARLFEVSQADLVDDFLAWKDQFRGQVLQLAAALETESEVGFAEYFAWLRDAWSARRVDGSVLVAALQSLSEASREALPEGLGPLLEPYFQAAKLALAKDAPNPQVRFGSNEPKSALVQAYLDALRSGEEPAAAQMLLAEAKKPEVGAIGIMDQVLAPAMREIGRQWHLGQATVAEEHLVTQASEKILARVLALAPHAPPLGRTALLSGVAGNAHSFGLQIVAGHFELSGWRAICLGSGTPASDLVQATIALGAHVVLLSATLETQIPSVSSTIKELRQSAPKTKILVGGQACARQPDLWKRLGADGSASNGSEALQKAESLLRDSSPSKA